MLIRLLLLALFMGGPRGEGPRPAAPSVPPEGAAAAARTPAAPPAAAADTILRRDLDRPPAAVRAGLAADTAEPHVRLGLRLIPLDAGGTLRLARPPLLPGEPVGTRWTDRLARGLTPEAARAALLRTRVREWGTTPSDTAFFLPVPEAPPARLAPTEPVEGATPRFQTDFADLALQVRSRMELGGDWSRYQPCDLQLKSSCNPTLIPQLSPEVQFGVQVQGTLLDRVQVDVDFDQAREFDAANRINIFYEGAEDDILRRLEVGDVTFNLPTSRFLTEGIPAGNFGFQAEGQLGPLDFQTVWAQQRGDLNSREFHLTGFGDQRAFVQDDTLVVDDADYVRGQFFFLVAPRTIDRFPHVDALALDQASAPPDVAPGPDPIQLYRFENDPVLRQQVEGFIQADARAEGTDGTVLEESGWFRYLQPGVDYYVHPSGLWIALRTPLRNEEMIAVTYITAAGDTVGDYNPERLSNAGVRPTLKLLKASGANHQPGRPTWDQEMHQVYRVSGSNDVEPGSVDLTISLGELSAGRTFKRGPSGDDLTFLRLLGLDEESPLDELDPAFVFSPGADAFLDQPPVQGTFVLFPTLRPFAEPPPLPSLGLTAPETAAVLGADANRRIYEEEDPYERDAAGLFRLTMSYRIRSEGVIASFSLGALGIRDASERVWLGDRLLQRDVDYTIDYDLGQVTLLEPEQLFTTSPDAAVRATWEQRSLFQVSPTQVFGLRTHAGLGSVGGIDFLTLYRSERTVVTRPQLGTEPGAALMGGLGGNVATPVHWMDRLLDRLPGLRLDGESSLSVNGELAVSLPDPNTRDAVFLDDFDAAAEVPVSLLSSDWQLGSAPTQLDGADAVLPPILDATTAVPLVWQHQWVVETPVGDSVGVHEGFFPQQIDTAISVAGSAVREAGLLLSFGRGALDRPAWRSFTTPLSTTGLDLTKTDFLEFYVAQGSALTLVVDLGSVSEDAFFVDPSGSTSGTRSDTGERWGLGTLDQEADPALGEIWNSAADQEGVWPEGCLAEPGRIYRQGDPRAICTAGNGRRDTEDLNGNGNLDPNERHLRYVVRLDGSSPYLARTRAETHTPFQLYRIPIRGPNAVEVGGTITDADLRAVKQLRITVAGPRTERLEITRMRLVGSRWIKRAGEGLLRGLGGDTLTGAGRLEVGTVSKVTEGAAYLSPPRVVEELIDPTSGFVGQGIEINEKSLGLTFDGVDPGTRAEVYHRFPQRPRNFLTYRQLRVWVVPRMGDFGPERPTSFFVKVGTDAENFYLYRTRLGPPTGPGGLVDPDQWQEVVVDFLEWFDLRQQAEERLVLDPPGPADPPLIVWSADSTYAVVLKDRGRAPDLAHVREMSMGVLNEGEAPLSGEVWIDELRLGRPVRDAGVATSLEAVLDGAGVLSARLTYTDRGALFQQLRDQPTYQTDRSLSLTSTLRLDRWAPVAWGVEVPLTYNLDRTSQDPVFLANSDVRAEGIRNLRPTTSRRSRVGIAFRKSTHTANPWVGLLVDGLDARASYTSSRGSTVTTESEVDALTAGLGWTREPERRDFALVPGFAKDALRAILPGFLEGSVVDARLRWTPERVSLGTSYLRQDSRITRYERIIRLPDDSLATATLAPRETMETAADVRFRPMETLDASLTFLSTRDLLPSEEAVTDPRIQDLIRAERGRLGGLDVGWETNRTLRTRFGFRPRVFRWLRNDLTWTTLYGSDRNANYVLRQELASDTLVSLTRNAQAQRDWTALLSLDPGLVAESLLGAAIQGEDPAVAQLRAMLSAFRPLSVTYQDGLVSRFHRDPVSPGAGYQLGFGSTDDFRFLDGDTAATLTDRSSWTLASGVRLPGGATVDAGYQRSVATTLDTRSDRRIDQKRWPDVRTSLPPIRPPVFTGMQRVSLSTGYTRNRQRLVYGGRGLQTRTQEDIQVPLDVSVTWAGSVVTAYRGSFRDGTARDPTGDTDRSESSHRLSVTSQILPPGTWGERLDRPIRLAFLAGYTAQRDCRTTVTNDRCVPFLDQIRRSLSLQLDTSVNGFGFGVQMSYDDRQSFVGQETGSTQFQVGIFGQLQFSAGMLPTSPLR